MTDFNPFTPPPISSAAGGQGQAPALTPEPPGPGDAKRKRGPRRVPGAAKAAKKPGRPRKAAALPERPLPGPSMIDLPKVIAAVAGLDELESKLVVDMAAALNNVAPYQAVRIACALGRLFS